MKLGEWIKDTRTYKRAALVAAVLILALGWITADILLMPRKKPPEVVEIPNLCGQDANSIKTAEWLDVDIEYRRRGRIFANANGGQPTQIKRRRLPSHRCCQPWAREYSAPAHGRARRL